jgi:hypothetical protein
LLSLCAKLGDRGAKLRVSGEILIKNVKRGINEVATKHFSLVISPDGSSEGQDSAAQRGGLIFSFLHLIINRFKKRENDSGMGGDSKHQCLCS